MLVGTRQRTGYELVPTEYACVEMADRRRLRWGRIHSACKVDDIFRLLGVAEIFDGVQDECRSADLSERQFRCGQRFELFPSGIYVHDQ